MEVREASVAYDGLVAADAVSVGYKRTEAGVIPEDWNAVPAGDIGGFRGGNGFPLAFQGKGSGDYPFFKVSDMNLDGNEIEMVLANNYISEAVRKRLGANAFPAKTIVFAKVGAAVFLERKKILCIPSCIDNNMAGYVLSDARVDHRFVHYFLLSFKLGSLVSTTALPSLSGGVLKQIEIPLPPSRAEQEAIAEALSDADALIESLEQLLAKKRQIKQGTMQELLTGKKRLPGFTGKWESKLLGDLGAFFKGSGVTRDQAQSGSLPCVRYGEIYTTHHEYVRSFTSWISAGVAATATAVKKGDVLFAGSGETKAEIGRCVALVDDITAYAGGDIVIFRPSNADPLFLGYALNTPKVNRQKASRGQGDAVVHISAAALAEVRVDLPMLDEQIAIAAILFDMDAWIDALETRLTKARALKQGMMQELLTGRVRLVQAVSNVVPLPKNAKASIKGKSGHNRTINEAVVIAKLTQLFGSDEWPLARVRRTKLAYLLHRHIEGRADGFLKKAAGPYDPTVRYKGPEGVALKNGYVRAHNNGTYEGFVVADNLAQAETYFEKWYGADAAAWLEQFQWKKTGELELLATVDMAMEDLRREGKQADLGTVKQLIGDHPEWKPKLGKAFFSDEHIVQALNECHALFGD
jgi:type I restriction enzyme S subunit